MSIRKHLPPNFPDFIALLKQHGFSYVERYRKAEALVGDSNSIALIDRYFGDHASRETLNRAHGDVRNAFFDDLLKEREFNNFDAAFKLAFEALQIRLTYP